jgi:hypothetical protein
MLGRAAASHTVDQRSGSIPQEEEPTRIAARSTALRADNLPES